jgi:hypothetical protein
VIHGFDNTPRWQNVKFDETSHLERVSARPEGWVQVGATRPHSALTLSERGRLLDANWHDQAHEIRRALHDLLIGAR